MKNYLYTKISLNIILIFIIMMVMSAVPEIAPFEWFYYYCPKGTEHGFLLAHNKYDSYHWTWRHWIWLFMGLSLFVVQVTRVVNMCINHKE